MWEYSRLLRWYNWKLVPHTYSLSRNLPIILRRKLFSFLCLHCEWMSIPMYVAYAIYKPALDWSLKKHAVPCCGWQQKHFSKGDNFWFFFGFCCFVLFFFFEPLTPFSVSPAPVFCAKSNINGQLTEHTFIIRCYLKGYCRDELTHI